MNQKIPVTGSVHSWPGTGLGKAAFYSYAYPQPESFRTAAIEPEAGYHEEMGAEIKAFYSGDRAI